VKKQIPSIISLFPWIRRLAFLCAAACLLFTSGTDARAPTISEPGVIILLNGGNASVTWNATASGRADLEHSADLSSWSVISSNNTAGSFLHAVGNATKGFYRLRIQSGPPGLVAYYPFSGNANDSSGNNRHGTVENAVLTPDRFGVSNTAYAFLGNSRIVVPGPWPGGASDRTVVLWFKTDNQSQNSNLLSMGANAMDQRFSLLLGYGGSGDFGFVGQSNDLRWDIGPVSDNQWRQLALAFSGVAGSGSMAVYLDGVSAGSQNLGWGIYPLLTDGTRELVIGSNVLSRNDEFFIGGIDDVRIYDRALEAAEIAQIYQQEVPPRALISLSGNLSFGDVLEGTSANRTLSIANTGTAALVVSGVSYPSGFSGNWSGTVAPGATQNVTVTFAPTAAQSYSGSLSVASNASGGISTLALSGTGVPAAPTITSAASANGSAGSAFSYQITASGSPTSFGASGLPSGLSVNSTTGLISGTPAAVGNFTVTLSATNSGGTGNASLALSVSQPPAGMISIQGGTLPAGSELEGTPVAEFQIGRYEVTLAEWQEVRDFAVNSGYTDLVGTGLGSAGNHPVHTVNWYQILKWCNARSEREGFAPVYSVNGTTYRTGNEVPAVSSTANGYRLPTEAQWEWAARGGASSQNTTYSGSNSLEAVGWYDANSLGASANVDGFGRGTWPVGLKAPNELGIYDMSGNILEMCWDLVPSESPNRRARGGMFSAPALFCTVAYREWLHIAPQVGNYNFGFRVARFTAAESVPVITSAPRAIGTMGQSFQYQITANQSTTPSFGANATTYSASGLPPNFTINSTTGLITGTPIGIGLHNATVSVTTPYGTGSSNFTISLAGPLIDVPGGTLTTGFANGTTVAAFQIGKFEVTWAEWQEVKSWAKANGYTDLADIHENVAEPFDKNRADTFPVEFVTWYDVIKWCNARSERDGFTPVYQVGGVPYRTGESVPTVNSLANGYRLPTEVEWEWAARGGLSSQGFTYSGGNDANSVAWAAALASRTVGTLNANELGIHDMSGNVWEWCWDASSSSRRRRGGSFNGVVTQSTIATRSTRLPNSPSSSTGFRLARNLPAAVEKMPYVRGGTLVAANSLNGTAIPALRVGKYEVTGAEWTAGRTWALANGYTNLASGASSGNDHPVRQVNWYDAVKWCNAMSEKDGFTPVYTVNGTVYRTGEFGATGSSVVTANSTANGYRLPTEAQWEWAARGGRLSANSTYSGGNDLNAVGWYWNNSINSPLELFENGRGTWPVGQKTANELGLHDMSGNVWEWCWDAWNSGTNRSRRGGSWIFSDYSCAVDYRDDNYSPDGRADYIGFRLVRNFLSVPAITSPPFVLHRGWVGESYILPISASNSPTSYASTGLPPGVAINATTGRLSGTPTAAGVYMVTVSATNAEGTGRSTFLIEILVR